MIASTREMPAGLQARFEQYLDSHDVSNGLRPERFLEVMKTHRNLIDYTHRGEPLHLERRNPLMVVLGDSVSCGHFEMIDLARGLMAHDPCACYMEKVRVRLQQVYPLTAVTLVNSAIAGDNIASMEQRLTRDVISHQPDLVVLNATLNWPDYRGTFADFQAAYRRVVQRILLETDADLLLLTPNITTYEDELAPRVQLVKDLADEFQLPMVDLHRMFTDLLTPEEYPAVLANGENHPTVRGHEFMARAIMKVLVEDHAETV